MARRFAVQRCRYSHCRPPFAQLLPQSNHRFSVDSIRRGAASEVHAPRKLCQHLLWRMRPRIRISDPITWNIGGRASFFDNILYRMSGSSSIPPLPRGSRTCQDSTISLVICVRSLVIDQCG